MSSQLVGMGAKGMASKDGRGLSMKENLEIRGNRSRQLGKGPGGRESNQAQPQKGQTPQHHAPRNAGDFHGGKIRNQKSYLEKH